MIGALLYLQATSFKNRIWARLRRLRQPKYFIGALFGGMYFAFVVLRPFWAYGRYGSRAPLPVMSGELWEFIGAALLFAVTLLIWLLPHSRAALVFSETEIAFLFPAPVRRSTLIHFKLIKSQTAILFTVLFLTLLSSRAGGLSVALMRAAGWWMLLSTINLHLLGTSFTRTLLLDRGVSSTKRRLVIVALIGALAGAAVWAGRGTPMLERENLVNADAIAQYLRAVADSLPAKVLLIPFRVAVRPFLAQNFHAFLLALGPALGLLALHYLWVVRSDVAFEESSLEASRRQAARVTSMRQGRWGARPQRRMRAPFRLLPMGAPAVALLWKNLLGAGQLFSLRVLLPLLAWAFFVGWTINTGAGHTVWPRVIGTMAAIIFVFSIVLGPQIVRQDFRQDLAVAELLKTYPMRGWQVALGELLAPTLILTSVQWVLLLLSATLLGGRISGRSLTDPSLRWAIASGAAIVAPMLNFVLLLISNASVLAFPAWFGTGQAENRGFEVMGQRLIIVFGQFFVFALAAVPAILTFGVVFLVAASPLLGDTAAIPVSALAAALMLAAEAAFGLIALGRLFERLDVSAER